MFVLTYDTHGANLVSSEHMKTYYVEHVASGHDSADVMDFRNIDPTIVGPLYKVRKIDETYTAEHVKKLRYKGEGKLLEYDGHYLLFLAGGLYIIRGNSGDIPMETLLSPIIPKQKLRSFVERILRDETPALNEL